MLRHVVAYTVGLVLVVAAWPRLEPLATLIASWPGAPSFGLAAIVGLAFGLLVAKTLIWNEYVESDRKQAIDKINREHDAKRK